MNETNKVTTATEIPIHKSMSNGEINNMCNKDDSDDEGETHKGSTAGEEAVCNIIQLLLAMAMVMMKMTTCQPRRRSRERNMEV